MHSHPVKNIAIYVSFFQNHVSFFGTNKHVPNLATQKALTTAIKKLLIGQPLKASQWVMNAIHCKILSSRYCQSLLKILEIFIQILKKLVWFIVLKSVIARSIEWPRVPYRCNRLCNVCCFNKSSLFCFKKICTFPKLNLLKLFVLPLHLRKRKQTIISMNLVWYKVS